MPTTPVASRVMWRRLGAFILLFLLAGTAHAEISGRVESVGFDGAYRPSCWTPMRVVVSPDLDTKTGQYEIRITQRDLDGDRAVYRTPITLTAGQGDQRFWAYFLPESVQGGLPDTPSSDLAQRLQVTIHDAGGKELATCVLEKINLTRIDPTRGSRNRGSMFVLRTPPSAQFAGTSLMPAQRSSDESGLVQLHQRFELGTISPNDFPDRAIGLEAVDTILWLDGDPRTLLATGGSTRFDALREWVRNGGHLVINTPAQWQVLSSWGDLMPVDVEGVESRQSLEPIYSLANTRSFSRTVKRKDGTSDRLPNPWDRVSATLQYAHARLRPGAIELVPIVWKEAVEESAAQSSTQSTTKPSTQPTAAIESPWLASKRYGNGCVTWIGSDITTLQNVNYGWEVVWPIIFGANRTGDTTEALPRSIVDIANDTDRQKWFTDLSSAEISQSVLLEGIALKSKTMALVGVSAIFFLVYWALAGPGLYIVLRMKKLMHLNWFAFGAAAVCGTLVTMLLVKLLVRGPPEMRHVSLVRIDQVGNEPAMIRSRIGMYIPRDGKQRVTITAGESASILPYSSHPNFTAQGKLVSRSFAYDVPAAAHEAESNETAELDLPYRSSLKRIEARWEGHRKESIEGSLKFTTRDPFVEGKLTNRSGVKLQSVYLVFSYEWASALKDYVVFIPRWDVDETIDVEPLIRPLQGNWRTFANEGFNADRPMAGTLEDWTERVWYRGSLRAGFASQVGDLKDGNSPAPLSIPMMSLFKRLPPMNISNGSPTALLASGARDLDASLAVHSGNLLIIAHADEQPIPLDFKVEGDDVPGSGRVIYQFVLPMKR